MADTTQWMLWGLALLLLLPVLVIGLGELADDVARSDTRRAYATPLIILRNGVVPLAFAAILLRQVAGIPPDHLAVKIVDTLLWIVVLNAALALLNLLLFSEKSAVAGQVRIPKLLLDILRFFFVVCGAAIVVSAIWGINLGSLVTALGIGSVVIGLALQDTLGSLFAGIALVSARHFRVGDWVKFGTEEGPVLAQNWRSVTIKTRSGDALVVPNGVIARNPLTVLGHGGSVILVSEFRFPYHYSPDLICALLSDVAHKTPGFHLDPAPVGRVGGLEDNGIRYVMAMRAVDPARIYAVRSEYLINLWFEAQRRGITFLGENNTRFHPHDQPLPASPSTPEQFADLLKSIPEFAYRDTDLRRLLAHATLERHREGQVLLPAGSVTPLVFVLTRGRARAVFPQTGAADIVLHEFEAGSFLLSKATLRGSPAPFALKAATEIDVLSIPSSDFKSFCAADTRLAQEIEQILSAREEAARRALARSLPDDPASVVLSDRAQLVRDLFKA